MTEFETTFEDVLAAVPEEHFDRSRFVPGVGASDADVILVGEAPGAQEVERGEPFVGRAGSQLDDALAELGVDRSDLYITNLVKVRPPNNRDPRRDEIDAWQPVLDAEIDRIDPEIIVTLGNFATRDLLDTDAGISEIHGQTFDVDRRSVVPTFHPAATLYDSSKQSEFEQDLQTVFEMA